MSRYNARVTEPKWQKAWDEAQVFKAERDDSLEKYYVLEMFPYPSGRIHIGHVRNYTMGDVVARFKSARGFNVLHPMGWDAFGLPAEQYAIDSGTHPQETTAQNIDVFRRQIQSLGFSYDWDREIDTTLANYDYHYGGTVPVGSFPEGVTSKGVHDMAGNVWEICAGTKIIYERKIDVTRGGGWVSPPSQLHASVGVAGITRCRYIGFRCAKNAE